MPSDTALAQLAVIATNDRATPSLVYRALLRSIRDGLMVPGAKLPNERELAQQLNTSRTAVRSALAMMERQGLVSRRVGSGTYLTDDADLVFDRMDQTSVGNHEAVPSFAEIVEGRLLFEPAMMHLVVNRVQEEEILDMRRTLEQILAAPTWEDFKEQIYALHRQMFASTKNKFLMQIMASILDDRRAVLFDGRDTDKPAPDAVRQQTHKDLKAIVDAIAATQCQASRGTGSRSPHAHAGDDQYLAIRPYCRLFTSGVRCQCAADQRALYLASTSSMALTLPADEDCAVVFASDDFAGDPVREVGVESVRTGVGARDLGDLVPVLKMLGEHLGEVFASAVSRNCDFHCLLLQSLAAHLARMSR